MAIRMLEQGLDIQMIAIVTEMSENEIRKMIKE